MTTYTKSATAIITLKALPRQAAQGKQYPCAIWCREERSNLAMEQQSKTHAFILQACNNIKWLTEVHARMLVTGFFQNVFLSTKHLRRSADAWLAVDENPGQDVSLWNSLINGYVRNGFCKEALAVYYQMQRAGLQADNYTFPCVLKACAGLSDLEQVENIHCCIIVTGFESDVFVGNSLIAAYAKCGSIQLARKVFDKMPQRNVVSWNAAIAGYAGSERVDEALKLFGQMQSAGVKPDSFTVASILPSCARSTDVQKGKGFHGCALKCGFESDVFVGNALIDMYAKCESIGDAHQVFETMHQGNVVSWNAMISAYAQNLYCHEGLKLFCQMQLRGVKPNSVTIASVLPAYVHLADLHLVKAVHCYITKNGFESHVVENSLIHMYAKCGEIEVACQVFDKLPQRDVVSWNAMIAGFAQNEHGNEALILFRKMHLAGIKPDPTTISSVLPKCAHLTALRMGEEIHNYTIKSGYDSDIFVGNALIDMYAKCSRIGNAHDMFEKIHQRNVVSWNALIAGYVQSWYCYDALELFCRMQLTAVKPNSITIASVISACGRLADLQQGNAIHAYILKSGFQSNAVVGNALIDMHVKCGSVEVAYLVFDNMYQRDVVSWNAMIAGYVQNGHCDEALKFFQRMELTGVKSDPVTMACVLQACACMASLQQGKEIHNYIIRRRFESDVFVGCGLINMYAKCERIAAARQVFDKMSKRDVALWSAMIAGYTQSGHCDEALKLFHQMELLGLKANLVTIASVLPACARITALKQGKEIHDYIIRCEYELQVVMGNALIDMYAKCGVIDLARRVFDRMSQRDVVSWNAMISGYGLHGLGEDALTLFYQMQKAGVIPNNITFIAVLSACSHAGLVDEGWQYFNCMGSGFGITPGVDHYACMVDLLGRAGKLDEAYNFINNMPLEPNAHVWGSLLNACRIHCNIELGECVAGHLFELEPNVAGYHVLLSNIYATAGRWHDVAMVREMMKNRGLKKNPGCTWIEINNRAYPFLVGDRMHPQSEKIYSTLESLAGQMKRGRVCG